MFSSHYRTVFQFVVACAVVVVAAGAAATAVQAQNTPYYDSHDAKSDGAYDSKGDMYEQPYAHKKYWRK